MEAWAMKRPARFILAAAALLVGFAPVELLLRQHSFVVASTILSIGLAILVGAGKLASP